MRPINMGLCPEASGPALMQLGTQRAPKRLKFTTLKPRLPVRVLAGEENVGKSTIESLDSLLGTVDADFEEQQISGTDLKTLPQGGETAAELPASDTVAPAQQQQQPQTQSSTPRPGQQLLQVVQQVVPDAGLDSNPTLQGMARALLVKWIQDQLKKPELVAAAGHTHLPRVVPRLSYIMLALHLLVYGTGLSILFTEGFDNEQNYFFSLAEINEAVAEGEYYRFLSSLFLHDSLSHLGVTVSMLYSVATQIESAVGYQAFLSVYLLSGLTGSVAAFALSDTITVGPSASLFGLIGALGTYLWKNRGMQRNADQIVLIAAAAVLSIAWGAKNDTFIDNVGHIAGLLSGGLLSWGISPLYDANDIDVDNRELAAERVSKMEGKSRAERNKAEAEAAELAALDLAVDKTPIWAKLLLPLAYASASVGAVVYILHDRIGHVPAGKWLPDLF